MSLRMRSSSGMLGLAFMASACSSDDAAMLAVVPIHGRQRGGAARPAPAPERERTLRRTSTMFPGCAAPPLDERPNEDSVYPGTAA
jgi:hypothetical protein